MTHISRGLDENGVLQIDILIEGNIPAQLDSTNVEVQPYAEDFVQMGRGIVFLQTATSVLFCYQL